MLRKTILIGLFVSVLILALLLSLGQNNCFAQARQARQARPVPDEEGFYSLFDGKTFNGWKISEEEQGTFTIKDGAIVANGRRSHCFYVGRVQNALFKNFELKVDVMTKPKSNGGVYFHTQYQEVGFPAKGFEVQVNNSGSDRKRTGGLYNVLDIMDDSPAKDDVWFTEHIIVNGKRIILKVDGKTVVDYTEPDVPVPPRGNPGRVLNMGTFSLQGHDPGSTVYYKNIKVKPLPW